LEVERRFVRRSDAVEMGDNEQKFQSRKCFLDHTFVQPILWAINAEFKINEKNQRIIISAGLHKTVVKEFLFKKREQSVRIYCPMGVNNERIFATLAFWRPSN
jgi:hypothetical protein